MAIAIAAGVNNRRMSPFGHRQETVRRAGGIDGVDSDFNGAICAVFKAYRAGEAGREFAVHL